MMMFVIEEPTTEVKDIDAYYANRLKDRLPVLLTVHEQFVIKQNYKTDKGMCFVVDIVDTKEVFNNEG